eukprot:353272-Chlamydomonas_euryale.AAC.7
MCSRTVFSRAVIWWTQLRWTQGLAVLSEHLCQDIRRVPHRFSEQQTWLRAAVIEQAIHQEYPADCSSPTGYTKAMTDLHTCWMCCLYEYMKLIGSHWRKGMCHEVCQNRKRSTPAWVKDLFQRAPLAA